MSTAAILFIHCHSALHCGSGSAVGSIDLPVQRERHTDWPLIPASTIKGVLRDRARIAARADFKNLADADSAPHLEQVFGPSRTRNAASEHAGAIAFTDAYPLLFPVRSLKGLFAWVTCPAALDRFRRDVQIAGIADTPPLPIPLRLEEGKAIVESESQLLVDASNLVLEEFEFSATKEPKLTALADFLKSVLALDRAKGRLAILSDEEFAHFVKNATEVQAQIALEYETKTVKEGALFYSEFVPPETVFVSLALAEHSHSAPREGVPKMTDAEVLASLRRCLEGVQLLQIGGDATTGKGLCRPILHTGAKKP